MLVSSSYKINNIIDINHISCSLTLNKIANPRANWQGGRKFFLPKGDQRLQHILADNNSTSYHETSCCQVFSTRSSFRYLKYKANILLISCMSILYVASVSIHCICIYFCVSTHLISIHPPSTSNNLSFPSWAIAHCHDPSFIKGLRRYRTPCDDEG